MASEIVLSNDPQERLNQYRDPKWGIQVLRTITIFDLLTKDELHSLYSFGRIRRFKAKTYPIIEGESTRGLYILLEGTASIYKTDTITNKMYRLALLERHAFFGELSLFDDAPRSASVSAETSCYLFYLDISKFEEFLQVNGDSTKIRFYKRCAEQMVERFREQNDDYLHSQQLLWKHALKKSDKVEKQDK